MTTARYGATATLLNDGTVLIAGGGADAAGTISAEIYDPNTGNFTTVGNMATKRTNHTATLLADGSVLIAGGQGNYNGQTAWKTAERYIPSSKQFTSAGNMTDARYMHTATLLSDGTVLIAGGHNNNSQTIVSTAEIYNPDTLSFSSTGSMSVARWQHTATPLMDGTILIAGGATWTSVNNTAEVYTPSSRTFTTTGTMTSPRVDQTQSLLQDGTVLVAGGSSNSSTYLASAELYSYPFTSGTMTPKYIVIGVLYSPPGSASSVSYTQSSALGTSSSITDTFTTNTSVSASLGLSVPFSKGVTGSVTGSVSDQWTEQADSTSTYTVNKKSSASIAAAGPLSSAIGIDHDYDRILVWLNPKVNISVGTITTTLLWNGYAFDSNDPYFSANPDIVELSLFCLKNPFLDPDCTANNYRTSRSWDTTSGLGGLTLDDYKKIASRDPFYANPSYDPDSDSSSRFTNTGQTVDYTPAAPGDSASSWSGSYSYETTSESGQDAVDSYQVSYSIDAGLKSVITADLKGTSSTTWTNKWSNTQTDIAGQSAAYSITGPVATDNYTGPTGFEVWQDNVYGTFMFVAPGTTPTSPGTINVSPSDVSFTPAVQVGETSDPVQITLTNGSSMSMFMGVANVFPFTSTSTANSPVTAFSDQSFAVVSGSDLCTGKIIAPHASCTLSIHFSPLSSDPLGSGGAISGTMYFTGETAAAVLATGTVTGTVPAASGAAATPTIFQNTHCLAHGYVAGVQMSDTTTGASIHYTMDGSVPTAASTAYSSPIGIGEDTTFKALATASGYANSAISTVTMTPSPCGHSIGE